MSNSVIDALRSQYPKSDYSKIDDDRLTLAIAEKFPDAYPDREDFQQDVERASVPVEAGNIDVSKQQRLTVKDGSVSTVRSVSANIDGMEVLLPTVIGNRIVSNEEAIANYKTTGQHLGKFESPIEANVFANRLHRKEAKLLEDNPGETPDVADPAMAHAEKTSDSMAMAKPELRGRSELIEKARPYVQGFTESMNEKTAEWAKSVDSQTLADAMDVIKEIGSMGGIENEEDLVERLATPQRKPSKLEEVLAGSQQAAADAINFFSSTTGKLTLGTSLLPGLFQKTIAAGFTAQMAAQFPQEYKEFVQAYRDGDFEGMGKAATSMGLSAAFIYEGGKSVAKGFVKPVKPEYREAAEDVIREQAPIDQARREKYNPDQKPNIGPDEEQAMVEGQMRPTKPLGVPPLLNTPTPVNKDVGTAGAGGGGPVEIEPVVNATAEYNGRTYERRQDGRWYDKDGGEVVPERAHFLNRLDKLAVLTDEGRIAAGEVNATAEHNGDLYERRKDGNWYDETGERVDSIRLAQKLDTIAKPEGKEHEAAKQVGPATVQATKESNESNASEDTKTTEVHGDVRTQSGEGERKVPKPQGSGGIQSQTKGGVGSSAQETPQQRVEKAKDRLREVSVRGGNQELFNAALEELHAAIKNERERKPVKGIAPTAESGFITNPFKHPETDTFKDNPAEQKAWFEKNKAEMEDEIAYRRHQIKLRDALQRLRADVDDDAIHRSDLGQTSQRSGGDPDKYISEVKTYKELRDGWKQERDMHQQRLDEVLDVYKRTGGADHPAEPKAPRSYSKLEQAKLDLDTFMEEQDRAKDAFKATGFQHGDPEKGSVIGHGLAKLAYRNYQEAQENTIWAKQKVINEQHLRDRTASRRGESGSMPNPLAKLGRMFGQMGKTPKTPTDYRGIVARLKELQGELDKHDAIWQSAWDEFRLKMGHGIGHVTPKAIQIEAEEKMGEANKVRTASTIDLIRERKILRAHMESKVPTRKTKGSETGAIFPKGDEERPFNSVTLEYIQSLRASLDQFGKKADAHAKMMQLAAESGLPFPEAAKVAFQEVINNAKVARREYERVTGMDYPKIGKKQALAEVEFARQDLENTKLTSKLLEKNLGAKAAFDPQDLKQLEDRVSEAESRYRYAHGTNPKQVKPTSEVQQHLNLLKDLDEHVADTNGEYGEWMQGYLKDKDYRDTPGSIRNAEKLRKWALESLAEARKNAPPDRVAPGVVRVKQPPRFGNQGLGIASGADAYKQMIDWLKEKGQNTLNFAGHQKAMWKSRHAKQDMSAFMDASENSARIEAKQQGTRVELEIKNSINRQGLSAKERNNQVEIDDRAVTFIIEAGTDGIPKLQTFKSQIAGSRANQSVKFDSTEAIDRAIADFGRLKPIADQTSQMLQDQMDYERASGINVDQMTPDYIAHAYDQDVLLKPGHLRMSRSSKFNFRKGNVYDNYADAIMAGHTPLSLRASRLVESRATVGLRAVNRKVWGQMLKGIVDPTDQSPVISDFGPNGEVPEGYEAMNLSPGVKVPVHENYIGVFRALVGRSHMAESAFGLAALKAEGFVKHGMLGFDTFHMFRMMGKQLLLTGNIGYKKGLSILDYSQADLQKAVQAGDITQQISDYATANRPTANLLINNGLNVGRVQESLYSDLVQHIPGFGTYNRFVFQKLTRGAMLESGIREVNRLKASDPNLTDDQAARRVSRDLNFYFGNLQRQGLFKNQTFRDEMRVLFLAPQWVEAMAQTELRSIGQILKYPLRKAGVSSPLGQNPALGHTEAIGTLGKGVGQGLLAYVVGTQLLNLATRGQFTWDNEEKGHKFDAFIPDPTGNSPGMWLNPASMVAEVSFDLYERYMKGEGYFAAPERVMNNKSSPLYRFGHTMVTGEVPGTGEYIPDESVGDVWKRFKEAGWTFLPIPFGIQPLYPAVGVKHGEYPGRAARQAFGTLGQRVQIAQNSVQQISTLARDWNRKEGRKQQMRITPFMDAPYHELQMSLRSNDQERLQKTIKSLRDDRGVSMKKMRDEMRAYSEKPFTGNAIHETAFKKTLSDEEKELYKQARQERKESYQRFLEAWKNTEQEKQPQP